jgi:hypothetical protein
MTAVVPSLIAVLALSLVTSVFGEWCAERLRIDAETGSKVGLVVAALAVPVLVVSAMN